MDEKRVSDTNLVKQIGRGNNGAFAELYGRHRNDVFRYAFAMSRSGDLAEDVTQDVFLNLLKNPSSYMPTRGPLHAWLLGCARNMMLGEFSRAKRWIHGVEARDPAMNSSDPDEDLLNQQRTAALHAAIVKLPTHFREVIVLCELQELSYAEAATVIDCPIGTVRSRLHRARELLAERLCLRAQLDTERAVAASRGGK